MAWLKVGTPPVFQSKLLCLSLLYLFTTLPLSIYVSLSQSQSNQCLFRSQSPLKQSDELFTYPSSYGEHKHAIPSFRSDCTTPLRFTEYGEVFEQMRDAYKNLSIRNQKSPDLRYEIRKADSFSGNYSFEIRKSFFNYSSRKEVPCGFLKELPLTPEDNLEMERCNGLVVISAIFNDHDKVRQPRGLGHKTLHSVCFFMFIDNSTRKNLISHQIIPDNPDQTYKIGAWRIVSLPTEKLPYENPAMNGVIFKYIVDRLFPNSHFSLWVDAKLQLTVDPLLLVHSLLVKTGADMALSKHPFNLHTMEEAVATVRWRKWGDVEGIRVQMDSYCKSGLEPWSPNKLPYETDVPDTALIIRRHNVRSRLFSCLMFNELEAFNPRDQLPFAFVRDFMNPKIKINMFDTEVFEHIAIEYRHNLKQPIVNGDDNNRKVNATDKTFIKMGYLKNTEVHGCDRYLSKMWGESTE
ncbi:transmembrane protein (DUF616) [Rhynchospora pubera]|uniref:Transmembrane protein (DUF616) n=1 Tax=Rhynchospora pubera TaxID=906938 RepID=A0AAV8C4P0_9POAL|nr:transmembrane protein (DUF616) [Rhynchospora pubera]KAJ4750124.1 transmembrane protein (DUF616) [Rhynchospora pubera]KAJ4796949.1 transmembrane protein (DUF616) [Rhynchospora pubera]